MQDNPHYALAKLRHGKGELYENAKISYLLKLPFQLDAIYIRNGVANHASASSQHLKKKYYQQIKEIHTARDFIEKAASFSRTTGRPYLIRFPDGIAYHARDIQLYELERLEIHLDGLNQAQADNTTNEPSSQNT